jgi:hypothetical protein
MNKRRLPLGLVLVAILQFIPPLVLPPNSLRGVTPVIWGFVAALFALLGISLLRRRAWSRVATIFVQGFNIIVRVLATLGNVVQGGKPGSPINAWMLGTTVVSVILSAVILYYVDLPDVQVVVSQSA